MIHSLEKQITNLSIALSVIFFLSLLATSLFKGGNWILVEQIALGQRLLEGNLSYANGQTDLFFPSSPYFPGVGYLSYIYSCLVTDNIYFNEVLMLVTAIAIGLIYFVQLQKLTLKIYPDIPKSVVLVLTVLFLATHFTSYTAYMVKFKPDAILLVLGMFALFIIEKNSKPTITSLSLTGLILFLSVFFKQSFFLIYFLVYLLILFDQFLNLKEKVIIFMVYSFIGLVALYFVFSIDNLYYYTVEVMSGHGMQNLEAIIRMFGGAFLLNILVCLSLIYFMFKRYSNFSFKLLETKYFIFALVWLSFSLVSSVKTGGNRGNIEAGLIVFMPFVIFVVNEIFRSLYLIKYLYYFVATILLVGILGHSFNFVQNANFYIAKLQNDLISIDYLSTTFKGKNVFVDGVTYVLAKESGLRVVTEIETVGHFNNIPDYDMSKLKAAIGNRTYDLVFLGKDLPRYDDKGIEKVLNDNYKVYLDKNLPSGLHGKISIVK